MRQKLTQKYFISTGAVPARRVPTEPSGHRAGSRPASLPPGVCRARPGDPRPTGCLPDEQVPLLVLQQGNASKSSFQHGKQAKRSTAHKPRTSLVPAVTSFVFFGLQLTVKALHMCLESGQAPQECCLRVSLMPLRLNIDQVNFISNKGGKIQYLFFVASAHCLVFGFLKDALFFLKDFFTSLSTEVEFFSPPAQEGNVQQPTIQYKH